MTSAGILLFIIGILIFQSTPATGQYDYDDLSVNLFTPYFNTFGLTSDQIDQLDLVSEDPTDYATFLLSLNTATAISINNQLIVVNGYIGQIYNAIYNITNVYYTAIGKNKKLNKKMDTAVNTLYEVSDSSATDMPDFATFQTAAKKVVPAAKWAAAYKSAKLFYTNLNSLIPAAAPIITATFGNAFST